MKNDPIVVVFVVVVVVVVVLFVVDVFVVVARVDVLVVVLVSVPLALFFAGFYPMVFQIAGKGCLLDRLHRHHFALIGTSLILGARAFYVVVYPHRHHDRRHRHYHRPKRA